MVSFNSNVSLGFLGTGILLTFLNISLHAYIKILFFFFHMMDEESQSVEVE